MTMPREIYCKLDKNNANHGSFVAHRDGIHRPTHSAYYSQAVIDEKDARIKELEEQLKKKDKRIIELHEENSYLHKIIDHHEAMENDDDF